MFHTNCTLPTDTVGFVSAPNTRGTLDILWTSLATIIACVYTVLHLDVPEQRPDRDRGWRVDLYWGLKTFWTSFKWAVITVVLPEATLTKAWVDWCVARLQLDELHGILKAAPLNRPEIVQDWTLRHMMYAGMGGFIATTHEGAQGSSNRAVGNSTDRSAGDQEHLLGGETPASGSEVISPPQIAYDMNCPGAAHAPVQSSHSVGESSRSPAATSVFSLHQFHLTTRGLVHAVKEGLVPPHPPITALGIADKSKSDVLGKTVAVFQVCYFLVGVIARAARHLPISQLELGTCAFVPYAVVTYLFSHHKPKSVSTATVIQHFPSGLPVSLQRICGLKNVHITVWYGNMFFGHLVFQGPGEKGKGASPSNGTLEASESLQMLQGTALFSIPFGLVHLGAWNSRFPTNVDLRLWRVAAITTIAAYPVGYLLATMRKSGGVSSITIGLLLISRGIIIVEMFHCLRYLPSEAYVSTWAANLPHIG